jgi:hypothetical protein
MDKLMKLSRETQAVLAASVLYLIFSFFDWQQVSAFGVSVGRSEWNGIGVIAGLLVIVLLLWEAARLFEVKIELGSLNPGLLSVAVALLLLVFTVITFLSHSTARHWPAWIGLLLSIVIAAAAVMRGKSEGVEMPKMPSAAGGMGGGGGSSSSTPMSAPPDAPGSTSGDESGDGGTS